MDVAIKEFFALSLDGSALEEVAKEVAILKKLQLVSEIVKIIGVSVTESPCWVLMERMSFSLYQVIHNPDCSVLPWKLRARIGHQITKGLEAIHENNIIHRDLKSSNILLDRYYNAKITDFGFARVKSQSSSSLGLRGSKNKSFVWSAPETLTLTPLYTFASDVYSCGVVLWELGTRQIPFSTETVESKKIGKKKKDNLAKINDKIKK